VEVNIKKGKINKRNAKAHTGTSQEKKKQKTRMNKKKLKKLNYSIYLYN